MRYFIVDVLDTAEQITPEKALDILTFAFRGEVLSVSEPRSGMCIHRFHAEDEENYLCIDCGNKKPKIK